MTEGPEVLTPVDPETWIERFVRRVSTQELDVAFVTPSGHVMSWAQFRFVYPRYREVDAEWQPPTESLDAIVLHFGGYEVAIPAAQLDLEFPLSSFTKEHHRLTGAWHNAHPDQTVALPMDARIMIERMAAVHSKIEVVIATYAYDRETAQDLLTIPGVRLERTRARLSEVSFSLSDEEPRPGLTDQLMNEKRADGEMGRKSWEQLKSDPENVEHMERMEADTARRRAAMLRYFANYPQLKEISEALHSEYGEETFQKLMFIEAVRRRCTTRDLLRLVRGFLLNGRAERQGWHDSDYFPWASLAHHLSQYRTAWCLAIRAFDGQWRDAGVHFPPYGSGKRTYPLFRSEHLHGLAELAQRSGHPYWSPIFSNWSADYDAGMGAWVSQNQERAETPSNAEADDDEQEEALLARVRANRRSFDDAI